MTSCKVVSRASPTIHLSDNVLKLQQLIFQFSIDSVKSLQQYLNKLFIMTYQSFYAIFKQENLYTFLKKNIGDDQNYIF